MNVESSSLARLSPPLVCPRCSGPVDVKSRHVAVAGSAVRVYCSALCLSGAGRIEEAVVAEEPARRIGWLIAAGIAAVGGAIIVVLHGGSTEEPPSLPPPKPIVIPAPPVQPAVAQPSAEEKARRAEDDALLAELMQDAWIHPLAGPRRRMPINHTAAFGAERAGERPPECASGHCGVDVGGSIWGEQVHAVHDGIVDWVNRGPNEEHGGIFVKIAHRGGTLFSWYFHLAAVPRWIQPGVKITAGQVIGLVGDTGVKSSGPHLHFSMSVKPSKGAHERYIDPEPLIAIWPLWIPDEGTPTGHMAIAEPGLPVRAPSRRKPAPPPPQGSDAPPAEGSAAKTAEAIPPDAN